MGGKQALQINSLPRPFLYEIKMSGKKCVLSCRATSSYFIAGTTINPGQEFIMTSEMYSSPVMASLLAAGMIADAAPIKYVAVDRREMPEVLDFPKTDAEPDAEPADNSERKLTRAEKRRRKDN